MRHHHEPLGRDRAGADPQGEGRTADVFDRRALVDAAATTWQLAGQCPQILVRPEPRLLCEAQPRHSERLDSIDPFGVDAERVTGREAPAKLVGILAGAGMTGPDVQNTRHPIEPAANPPRPHQSIDLIERRTPSVPDCPGVIGAEGGDQVVRRTVGDRSQVRGGVTGVTAAQSPPFQLGHGIAALFQEDGSGDAAHTRANDGDVHMQVTRRRAERADWCGQPGRGSHR